MIGQAGHPAADGLIVLIHVGDELKDALIQLRQQHGGQQVEEEPHHQPGKQNAHGANQHGLGALPLPLRMGREEGALEEIHHRGQQIGDEGPVEDRPHGLQQGQHGLPAEEGVVKQQNGGGGHKRRHPHADVMVFPFHGPRLLFSPPILHGARGNCNPLFPAPWETPPILTVISQALCYTVR